MAQTFRADDWDHYVMDYHDPWRELEPLDAECALVERALGVLRGSGVLPDGAYDESKLLAHRRAVHALFDVPWTAITPRMERLLYAMNAVRQPGCMIAAGVFCGVTFISNAGAGVGPGACYTPRELIGVEIRAEEAERAERNVRRIDPTGVARVVAADAIDLAAEHSGPIDLLYLDADGGPEKGKGVYLDILQAAYDRLSPGALVLAHNSVNAAERLEHYLAFVRDPAHMRASVNVIVDREGLEVSAR